MERLDLPIRITVGFGGSAGAQTVVKQVAHRTWPAGSDAFIVAVDQYLKPTKPETEMNVLDLIATAEEHLRAATGLLVRFGERQIGDKRRVVGDSVFDRVI